MTPQSESSGVSPPIVTEERAYEMGYLNHRERQSKRLTKLNTKYNDCGISDVESVASSRLSSRIKQKPKPRNGRRRRSKNKGDKSVSGTSKSSSRPTSDEVKSYNRTLTATPNSVFGAISKTTQSYADSTVNGSIRNKKN